MISVTVAAHGKSKRMFGGNLKAYGSGRLSLCDLEKEDVTTNEKTSKWRIGKIFDKILQLFILLYQYYFPIVCSRTRSINVENKKKTQISSFLTICDEKILCHVFENLGTENLVKCKFVCQKWKRCIDENAFHLKRERTDQIRILFDEGEVVIYPMDEKKCPVRHSLPPLQILRQRIKHLTTQSLFIRGLIPVESTPVLKLLLSLDLQPQQMYFIWSNFSPSSVPLFERLIIINSKTVMDFGLEECSPPHLLTDQLLFPISQNLTSLRLWNNDKYSQYGVTDKTILKITESISAGKNVETIDLGTCYITTDAIVSLIGVWKKKARCDLTLILSNCQPVNKFGIFQQLLQHGIQLIDNCYLHSRTCTLTFVCR